MAHGKRLSNKCGRLPGSECMCARLAGPDFWNQHICTSVIPEHTKHRQCPKFLTFLCPKIKWTLKKALKPPVKKRKVHITETSYERKIIPNNKFPHVWTRIPDSRPFQSVRGGNFTQNPILRSKIAKSRQGQKIEKTTSRPVTFWSFLILFVFMLIGS